MHLNTFSRQQDLYKNAQDLPCGSHGSQSVAAQLCKGYDESFVQCLNASGISQESMYLLSEHQAYWANPFRREIDRRMAYLSESADDFRGVPLAFLVDPHDSVKLNWTDRLADSLKVVLEGPLDIVAAKLALRDFSWHTKIRNAPFDGTSCALGERVGAEENYLVLSDSLVRPIFDSKRAFAKESECLQYLMRLALSEEEFFEVKRALEAAQKADEKSTVDDVKRGVESELRLFIETVGKVTLGNSPIQHFVLTYEGGAKFLPSVEVPLLAPFRLTTENKMRFLQALLPDLRRLASSGAFHTAHGRLTMLHDEIVIEKISREQVDLFALAESRIDMSI